MLHRDAGKIEQRSQLLALARCNKKKEDHGGVFMTRQGANSFFLTKITKVEIILKVFFESSTSTKQEFIGY